MPNLKVPKCEISIAWILVILWDFGTEIKI